MWIFLCQSFTKSKTMSNLHPTMFVGLCNTSKRLFRLKSQKSPFPQFSTGLPIGVSSHLLVNKCCFCCLKGNICCPKFQNLSRKVSALYRYFYGILRPPGCSEMPREVFWVHCVRPPPPIAYWQLRWVHQILSSNSAAPNRPWTMIARHKRY